MMSVKKKIKNKYVEVREKKGQEGNKTAKYVLLIKWLKPPLSCYVLILTLFFYLFD